MPDTLFQSLLGNLNRLNLSGIPGAAGNSDVSLSQGLESSLAAVIGGLKQITGDSKGLQQVVDLAAKAPSDLPASAIEQSRLAEPQSPLLSGGRELVALLFGSGESSMVQSIASKANLRSGITATLLAVAAQAVLGWFGTRVRDDGMSAGELGSLLQKESGDYGSALPAGFQRILTGGAAAFVPAAAKAAEGASSSWAWILGVLLALLVLAGLCYSYFAGRAPVPAVPGLGGFVGRVLPNGINLNVPSSGVEARLLAFIQDPNRKPDKTSWFDFDRLLFATGSATLEPQSEEQLQNIANILKAYPNVQIKIGGYTDNVGNADQNLALSQQRANNVMAELVRLGVAQDRLTAQGYGEDHAIGDNTTADGRARNRRISMLVEQK